MKNSDERKDSNWVTEELNSSNKILIENENVLFELQDKLFFELTRQEVILDKETNNSENC